MGDEGQGTRDEESVKDERMRIKIIGKLYHDQGAKRVSEARISLCKPYHEILSRS